MYENTKHSYILSMRNHFICRDAKRLILKQQRQLYHANKKKAGVTVLTLEKAELRKKRKTTEWKKQKTRDHFKKIGDIKETFYARMDTIKTGNGDDLREAEGIKMQQDYTEDLYKKGLNDSGNKW